VLEYQKYMGKLSGAHRYREYQTNMGKLHLLCCIWPIRWAPGVHCASLYLAFSYCVRHKRNIHPGKFSLYALPF
jgi:hypothetical protein